MLKVVALGPQVAELGSERRVLLVKLLHLRRDRNCLVKLGPQQGILLSELLDVVLRARAADALAVARVVGH